MRSIERFVSRAISAPHQGQASSARSSRRISEGSPIGSVEAALQRVKMRLGAELRAIFPMARRQFPSAPDAPRALHVDHPLLRPFGLTLLPGLALRPYLPQGLPATVPAQPNRKSLVRGKTRQKRI